MAQTILLADGDATVRSPRCQALRNAGFEVIATASGADALKLAFENGPALIVLAVELAGIDGFSVCKQLKADLRSASIPVLHISNRGERVRDYPESLQSGAEAYLQEPVEREVLLAVVTALTSVDPGATRARKADSLVKDTLEALIDSIPDEVWLTDAQGRFTLANPAALREFNIDASAVADVESLAKSLEVYRADRSPRPIEEAPPLRALSGETVRDQEEIVRTPFHGELRYRRVSASPVRNAAGKVVGTISVVRDITEQKRAEQALRASEERVRLFVEHAPAPIAMLDLQMRYIAFSRRWLTDYLPGEQDLIGRSHYELFPEVPERWKEIHRRCLAGAVEGCEEDPFPRADGKLDWVRWEIHPWRNATGEIGGIVIFSELITDRKRAELELKAKAVELEEVTHTLDLAHAMICKLDGTILFATSGICQLYGFSRDELLGKRAHEVLRTRFPKPLDQIRADLLRERQWTGELSNMRADGSTVWVASHWALHYDNDGRPATVLKVGNDVTDRRRYEDALTSSEGMLRALLESAAQGVVAVDETGRILLVNARTEELFGYSRNELLGQPLELLVPEHLRAEHSKQQKQYFGSPRARPMSTGLDLRGRRKDGADISLDISLSFVEERGKQLALALITDVTERKRAEASLREAQKLESLGLLAGGVAHDFNNLLVGVIGNASLAQDMLPPDHPAAGLLDEVLKTGEQAAHLTRQMLAYSGRGKFLLEPLNLSLLIPEMTGLVRPSIPRKIELQLDVEPDLPAIEADRGQVQQVFMNLALNAAEAIGGEQGAIIVRTFTENVNQRYMRLHPETPALPAGKYVCLEVRDTGCGMDEATKARIFDPFFSTKFTGRGLGLAAVAGILRGHRGAIAVDSGPGKGSRFTVLFPAAEPLAGKPPAARSSALQGSGVILVVDDEAVVGRMAQKALERHGYTVLLAESGLAAIDVLKRYPGEIALIVLDLSMPHMNAEEALPELRKIRPGIKVVVSSGYSESETMTLFSGQRVSGFIQKPYTASRLAEKVRGCLG